MLKLRNIALITWILFWTGPLCAYLLSASAGYVDWCVPHLTGCDSISASGRHGWGYFVFKATMLPAAGLTFVYWILCYQWLNLIIRPAPVDRVILGLGLIGALFLIMYVTFLGSDGDVYRALRRYGTVVFFGFTFLAQLLFSKRIIDAQIESAIVRWKYRLAIFMFVAAAVLAVLTNFFDDDDFLQNISEWNFASALTAFPLLTWIMWRHTQFNIEFRLGSR